MNGSAVLGTAKEEVVKKNELICRSRGIVASALFGLVLCVALVLALWGQIQKAQHGLTLVGNTAFAEAAGAKPAEKKGGDKKPPPKEGERERGAGGQQTQKGHH